MRRATIRFDRDRLHRRTIVPAVRESQQILAGQRCRREGGNCLIASEGC